MPRQGAWHFRSPRIPFGSGTCRLSTACVVDRARRLGTIHARTCIAFAPIVQVCVTCGHSRGSFAEVTGLLADLHPASASDAEPDPWGCVRGTARLPHPAWCRYATGPLRPGRTDCSSQNPDVAPDALAPSPTSRRKDGLFLSRKAAAAPALPGAAPREGDSSVVVVGRKPPHMPSHVPVRQPPEAVARSPCKLVARRSLARSGDRVCVRRRRCQAMPARFRPSR